MNGCVCVALSLAPDIKILTVIILLCYILLQFYTFLETTLATISLLPHFKTFFSYEEIPGTPGTLATTFLAFGRVSKHAF